MVGSVIYNPYIAKAGTVSIFPIDTVPTGWLKCDGSTISRTTYKALFDVIGTTYGAGNGTTTFQLPNLVNKFIEGGTSGSYKSAGLPNITGTAKTGTVDDDTNSASGCFTTTTYTGKRPVSPSSTTSRSYSINASRSSSIYGSSTTVQPPALCMSICIKY